MREGGRNLALIELTQAGVTFRPKVALVCDAIGEDRARATQCWSVRLASTCRPMTREVHAHRLDRCAAVTQRGASLVPARCLNDQEINGWL
jgi:hypothetical protein